MPQTRILIQKIKPYTINNNLKKMYKYYTSLKFINLNTFNKNLKLNKMLLIIKIINMFNPPLKEYCPLNL